MNEMQQSSSVEDSLNEIASLLLMIHEHYLKNLVGVDITVALVSLVENIGLSCDVSVLDIERLRRNRPEFSVLYPMEFDTFFTWLRSLAKFIYSENEGDGRVAFHHLLVNYLVPAVSSLEQGGHNSSPASTPLVYITESAWKIYSVYEEFVTLTFLSLCDEVNIYTI